MSTLPSLCSRAGVPTPSGLQWIQGPLKGVVLDEWRRHDGRIETINSGTKQNQFTSLEVIVGARWHRIVVNHHLFLCALLNQFIHRLGT